MPTVYAVLLYPPRGVPRVIELPQVSDFTYPARTFDTPSEAAAALEDFLSANPEYRRWKDGRVQEPAPSPAARDAGGEKP